MSTRALVSVLSLVAVAVGCGPQLELETDDAAGSGDSSAGTETGGPTSTTSTIDPDSSGDPVPSVREVDILFVVDNSGSMGEEQAKIAASIGNLVGVLGGASPPVDYRIGVTTTDSGNPWCQTTTPEAGALVATSCRSRLPDFVFEGAQTIDVTNEACLDLCPLESLSLTPTPTHLDPSASSRPWLEFSTEGDNLGGLDLQQVVRCVTPQGIDGCGFESPLETMHKALQRSDSVSDAAHGFLRPWARLGVVFITDEVDCSVDSAWEEIFLPDGGRVFWSDPQSPAPTSAVCWNAGVQCENESGDLGACNPQNYDVEGNVTDAASAVMVSLTRYIEGLQAIEQSKAPYLPEGSVMVSVVGGVPIGYPSGEEPLVYSRGLVPGSEDFVRDFGVEPGCAEINGTAGAVPPVRLRAMAELFPVGSGAVVQSVCDATYGLAAESLLTQFNLQPNVPVACMPGCLADVDPDAAGTQVQCDVIMTRAGDFERESVRIPSCAEAEPAEACYELRVDDEAASACAEVGSNAQLELVLPEGEEVQGILTIESVCEMAPADRC